MTIVACGTAFHPLVAKYAIESTGPGSRRGRGWCLSSGISDPVLDRGTLVIAISQSGETADTLEAVRHAKAQKAKVLAICNTNGSQIPREADAVLYTGPDRRSASPPPRRSWPRSPPTISVGLALAPGPRHQVPRRGAARVRRAGRDARPGGAGPRAHRPGDRTGRRFAQSPTVLFLGRHVGYPVALEGALKLKELAYMHAEGFAAGELQRSARIALDR